MRIGLSILIWNNPRNLISCCPFRPKINAIVIINFVFNILEIGFAEKVFGCLKLTRSGGNVKTSKIAALHCDSRKSTQSIFIPFIPIISRIHCSHFYPTSNSFLNAVEKYKAQIYYRRYFNFFTFFKKSNA
jgi:hypothetical protein